MFLTVADADGWTSRGTEFVRQLTDLGSVQANPDGTVPFSEAAVARWCDVVAGLDDRPETMREAAEWIRRLLSGDIGARQLEAPSARLFLIAERDGPQTLFGSQWCTRVTTGDRIVVRSQRVPDALPDLCAFVSARALIHPLQLFLDAAASRDASIPDAA